MNFRTIVIFFTTTVMRGSINFRAVTKSKFPLEIVFTHGLFWLSPVLPFWRRPYYNILLALVWLTESVSSLIPCKFSGAGRGPFRFLALMIIFLV